MPRRCLRAKRGVARVPSFHQGASRPPQETSLFRFVRPYKKSRKISSSSSPRKDKEEPLHFFNFYHGLNFELEYKHYKNDDGFPVTLYIYEDPLKERLLETRYYHSVEVAKRFILTGIGSIIQGPKKNVDTIDELRRSLWMKLENNEHGWVRYCYQISTCVANIGAGCYLYKIYDATRTKVIENYSGSAHKAIEECVAYCRVFTRL